MKVWNYFILFLPPNATLVICYFQRFVFVYFYRDGIMEEYIKLVLNFPMHLSLSLGVRPIYHGETVALERPTCDG